MAGYKNMVYIIAGPTAVGKTAIAIQLAQHLSTSIVSADSRQCYKEMSIGTAKPADEDLKAVPHYFINSHSITDHLSTADFEQLSLQYLAEIFKQTDTAVVCGGTGLYIKSLCEGIDEMPPVSEHILNEVKQQYDEQGLTWLQNAIAEEDPKFYAEGEVENPVRVIRALAFVRSTGSSIIQYRTGKKAERPFNIVKIALHLPREVLYERINKRVDIMMEQGLLKEAEALYPQKQLKNLQTVGYTELFDYMDGKYDLPTAIEKIKQHSRNYAKRQLTWFRKDKAYKWVQADERNVIEAIMST